MQAHFQVGGGLDIFGKTGILNIVKVLPGNGRLPMITKRSNRWFAVPSGYFFTVAGLGDKDKKSGKSDFPSIKP